MAKAEDRRVILTGSDGSVVPMGTFKTTDDGGAIKAAAKTCRATLKRLTQPGYRLQCGSASVPLEQLRSAFV